MINWLDSENVNDFYLFIDIACFDRNEKLRSLAGKRQRGVKEYRVEKLNILDSFFWPEPPQKLIGHGSENGQNVPEPALYIHDKVERNIYTVCGLCLIECQF